MYICTMVYPKDIVLIPVMRTPVNVYFNISELLLTASNLVLSSQNCLHVNRPMTSLEIPQHATTWLQGVPQLLSVPLDTGTSFNA